MNSHLIPYDAIAAFGMTRYFISRRKHDLFLVVATEAHAYGYFFEKLGVDTIDVFVPYPPESIKYSDLSCMREKRVLVIEDDTVCGDLSNSLSIMFQSKIRLKLNYIWAITSGLTETKKFPNQLPIHIIRKTFMLFTIRNI